MSYNRGKLPDFIEPGAQLKDWQEAFRRCCGALARRLTENGALQQEVARLRSDLRRAEGEIVRLSIENAALLEQVGVLSAE